MRTDEETVTIKIGDRAIPIKRPAALKWTCYDADGRNFAVRTNGGTLFTLPRSEAEKIADFLRSESKNVSQ